MSNNKRVISNAKILYGYSYRNKFYFETLLEEEKTGEKFKKYYILDNQEKTLTEMFGDNGSYFIYAQ